MHMILCHSELLLAMTGQERMLMGPLPTMLYHLVMQVIQEARDTSFMMLARNLMMPPSMLLPILSFF